MVFRKLCSGIAKQTYPKDTCHKDNCVFKLPWLVADLSTPLLSLKKLLRTGDKKNRMGQSIRNRFGTSKMCCL